MKKSTYFKSFVDTATRALALGLAAVLAVTGNARSRAVLPFEPVQWASRARAPAASGPWYHSRVHLASQEKCTQVLVQIQIAANFENS